MRWLTDTSRLKQQNNGLWLTLDNQLFKDENGDIILAPRKTITDCFTIPAIFVPIVGNKLQWDVRCSIQHDFECKFAQIIKVNLSEEQLYKQGYLKLHRNMIICENIPVEHLEIKNVSFKEANDRFKRMLTASGSIPKTKINLMRFSVNFNTNWHSVKTPIDLNNIYEMVGWNNGN